MFDHTLTNRLGVVGPHHNAGSISISPNGRWVTTGSRSDRSVHIWDVASEELIQSIPVHLHQRTAFSNDGRWLAVTGDQQCELRETGSWKLAPPFPFREKHTILGAAAFSPDSRIMAIVTDWFTVQLFDLEKFKSIGVLRPPGSVQILGLAFSPDGSRLATVGTEARVGVWNIRNLEQQLQEFQLGWDQD